VQKAQFDRTTEENHTVGYYPEMMNEVAEEDEDAPNASDQVQSVPEEQEEDLSNEVLQLPTQCHLCGRNCMTKMKLTKIPLFKEVVIMATDCDHCGSRTNEVKSGGGMEPKGRRIQLKVTGTDDLCRDILKASG
jgi:zinc finger protein